MHKTLQNGKCTEHTIKQKKCLKRTTKQKVYQTHNKIGSVQNTQQDRKFTKHITEQKVQLISFSFNYVSAAIFRVNQAGNYVFATHLL